MPLKSFAAAIAVAVSAFAVVPASADGFYVSAFAGLSWQKDQNNVQTEVSVQGPTAIGVDFESGLYLGGALGYRFDDIGPGAIRVELEYAYRENNADAVVYSSGVRQLESGDNSSGSGMINLVYEFDKLNDWVHPYLGVGLGIAGVESDVEYAPPAGDRGNPTVALGGNTDAEFAYQFIGGVSVPVSEQWEVFVEGRYYETGDPDFDRIRISDDTLLARYDGEFSAWHGDVGVRFRF
ncbi:MAG: outer membrane beta-barrel protein [Sphingomonadales bacterium]|jgi:opacity protein-like surface antigen